ncbi:EAL domain-containing protein (putative c-di-GMP-specific phosphodiesterase class I)/uncharacterized membrane protein (UPF0136 family) [Ancylobacter sp. 3268]|uniref:putative bifunctional diguanylate cyclase/phosphodiesterase n=1 Tax=Ancylobacter sp. 3268 TaxID=2817752 RepID=UPI00285DA794|nr:EAL domain-containing protein [Ancylobacter sp. 3268]MDR6951129.1 EAL domain-containing protein (putative c-di-GMP-specific phosphodiesterase class I)/uncharacterized membrane protein (UPF0136 family) [Ancylobacter sp. 3268]
MKNEGGYTPQILVRRSVRLAPKLAVAGIAFALLGLAVFGFGWGIALFPGTNVRTFPLNSAALLLIGIAALRLRPSRPVIPTYGLVATAAVLALLKPVLVLFGWITGPTTINNTIMIELLALAVVLVAQRRIAAGQFLAMLSMLLPISFLVGWLYTAKSFDGSIVIIVIASGLLSGASVLCGTANRGPLRHLLAPNPEGRLQRARLTVLVAATIGLGYIGTRLDFHREVVPLIITAMVGIIIVMVTDIFGYLSRVAEKASGLLLSGRPSPLDAKISEALHGGDFSLYYQPQVDLSTNRTVGMEALARWQDPELGMVSPAVFIPAAEASGEIIPLGYWLLERACEQGVRWQGTVLDGVPISVNVSPVQLKMPDFVENVRQILCRTGFPQECLILELTESGMVRRGEPGFQALWTLHEMGLKISIDDFGTGYSCLAYLHDLPVTYLKIDQSFVRRLPSEERDVVVARSIVGLGRGLGLIIVAEGVETPEQADFLRGIWCDKAQGHLFSRPLDADAVLEWAMRHSDGKALSVQAG